MNGGRRARISSLILLHILFISQIFYESNQTVYILLEHNCDNLECIEAGIEADISAGVKELRSSLFISEHYSREAAGVL